MHPRQEPLLRFDQRHLNRIRRQAVLFSPFGCLVRQLPSHFHARHPAPPDDKHQRLRAFGSFLRVPVHRLLESGLNGVCLLHRLNTNRVLAKPRNARLGEVEIVHLPAQPQDQHIVNEVPLCGPYPVAGQIKPRHGGLTEGDPFPAQDPGERNRGEIGEHRSGRHLVHLGHELVQRRLIHQDHLAFPRASMESPLQLNRQPDPAITGSENHHTHESILLRLPHVRKRTHGMHQVESRPFGD